MNRNLLPLTLFGVGFVMLYSGYKGLHPITDVIKPVLQGKQPAKGGGAYSGGSNLPGPHDPGFQQLDPNKDWQHLLTPQAPASTTPPPSQAGGWSSSGGQGISA